jgi:aminopeptidase N
MISFKTQLLFVFLFQFVYGVSFSQTKAPTFTREDSLRGGNGNGRMLWNVLHYDLRIKPDLKKKSIKGTINITFRDSGAHIIQLDLQKPMCIERVYLQNKSCKFKRDGNVYWVKLPKNTFTKPENKIITVRFSGTPKEAKRAPWDGGWVWKTDQHGNPFVSVACQGLGSSSWFPCKDIQSDEPDFGCSMEIEVPDSLTAVSNGKMTKTIENSKQKTRSFFWETNSPINNYNIVPYIGKYKLIEDQFQGLDGLLSIRYWVLQHHVEKARSHFADVKKMLTAFEHYFGAFPFYADGYQLVEAPYLGMEHQSAIAYGNEYKFGYLGTDRSGTGLGLDWDFIVVHESGHEWFGNSITAHDMADNWIHESFTTYAEALYIEYYQGKNAATQYLDGLKIGIDNDESLQTYQGVNREPTSDIYSKGANVIHTLRKWINDDKIFFDGIREMNKRYRHKIVTSSEIEKFWQEWTRLPLNFFFNQYLRTNKIPHLNIATVDSEKISLQWDNVVSGFSMPVDLIINDTVELRVYPTEFQTIVDLKSKNVVAEIRAHPAFLILTLPNQAQR